MDKRMKRNLLIIGGCIILGVLLCIILYKSLHKQKEGLYSTFDIHVIKKTDNTFEKLSEKITAGKFETKSDSKDNSVDNINTLGTHPTHMLKLGNSHAGIGPRNNKKYIHVKNHYYIPENCKSALLVVKEETEPDGSLKNSVWTQPKE